MPQQQSPWLEGAYGWNFGEGGWNTGMDSNLLKFSFMFDGNVDSVAASLPPISNGAAHFLTTDNRFYFGVGTIWYSSPCPKWFQFKIKSTGVTYQFNGADANVIDNPAQVDARLDATELTISQLGSAAFEDKDAFATSNELDIVEALAQAYTDALRQDLADAVDPSKGAALVGYAGGTVGRALDEFIRPWVVGAVGDGIADDTSALLATLQDGRPIYLGGDDKVYRITSELNFTALRSVVIHSDGAKIIVDSPASIRSAIRVNLNGEGLCISGRLFLDCQLKSYSGFYASNFGDGVQESDVLISGLEVSNCHRTGTTFTGGDGIFIGGNFNKCRVVDSSARNIRMAAGAGVFGSQGVSGMTISRDNTNSLDATLITVDGCEFGPVYSDDVAYTADQDGLKIFTMYSSAAISARQVFASVENSRFVNCHGRAIKIQTEWASVDNIKIERSDAVYGAGFIGNPDIDFQVSGGQASNIQCQYRSNFPARVLSFTLTRDDARIVQTCAQVSNLSVVQSGSGDGTARIMSVATEFDATAQVSISGASVTGVKIPVNFLTVQSQVVTGLFAVSLTGIVCRVSSTFVTRVSSVLTPCFITGSSIVNQGSTVPFASPQFAGDFTVSLLGANRFVT